MDIIITGNYLRAYPRRYLQQFLVIGVQFFKRKLQMKKSLVFAAMLAIALAACGKKEEAKPAEAPAAAPAAPAADAAKDAAPAAPAADAKK
jgi:predicted small lipoprotein YifL